jgi:hypothetical protein
VSGQEVAPVPETQYLLTEGDVNDVFPTWDEFCAEVFDLR